MRSVGNLEGSGHEHETSNTMRPAHLSDWFVEASARYRQLYQSHKGLQKISAALFATILTSTVQLAFTLTRAPTGGAYWFYAMIGAGGLALALYPFVSMVKKRVQARRWELARELFAVQIRVDEHCSFFLDRPGGQMLSLLSEQPSLAFPPRILRKIRSLLQEAAKK